jgi:hypothetical protein
MATHLSTPSPSRLTQWLLLATLLVLVMALESFALYTVFTTRYPGANDFYVRWLGGREFLLRGTNPFDRSVAEKAQIGMFGRLTRPEDKDQAYFAYPLYTLYLFFPLSYLKYPLAQAIWMVVLQFTLLGSTVLAVRLGGWEPPRWLFWVTVLWGILFYSGARAIILGQFSVLVGTFLLLALWAIEHRHDGWAGVFLALTTIKPQMVFLVLAFLLLWALVRRRWRLVGSFAISLLILVGSSMLLVPSWPLDFMRNAIAYTDYVAFGTPLENLLHYLLPAEIAAPLTPMLSALLFLALLPGWWQALRDQPGGYTWSVLSTLIVGSLITFRSATANQVILYLPLFLFFRRLVGRWAAVVAVLVEVGLATFMWGVFAATLEGNWEHVMMHGVLPALMLALYAVDWRALMRTAREVET